MLCLKFKFTVLLDLEVYNSVLNKILCESTKSTLYPASIAPHGVALAVDHLHCLDVIVLLPRFMKVRVGTYC